MHKILAFYVTWQQRHETAETWLVGSGDEHTVQWLYKI
jgi:hypothetical protein